MTALDQRRPAIPRPGRLSGLRDGAVALLCGLLSALAGLAAMAASQDGHLSASNLVKIASTDPLAALVRRADPSFHFVTGAQHYDGSYYYAIARDPLLTGQAHTLIDGAGYRYGHPLHGWLAGMLSLGDARAVPMALLILGLAGSAVGAWAASRLAVAHGRSPWSGLVVGLSPGLLYATTVDTTETVGVALIALLFLAWIREQLGWAVTLSVLVCLDKDQYVVVPLGLGLWEVIEAARRRGWPGRVASRGIAATAGPVALIAWYAYIRSRLHAWPWQAEQGTVGTPLVGWRTTFRLAHHLADGSFDQAEIGSVTPPVLVAVAGIVLLAVVIAVRVRTVFAVPLIASAGILSTQTWQTLLYPHELVRTPAVVLLLAIAVIAFRRPTRLQLQRDRPPPELPDAP